MTLAINLAQWTRTWIKCMRPWFNHRYFPLPSAYIYKYRCCLVFCVYILKWSYLESSIESQREREKSTHSRWWMWLILFFLVKISQYRLFLYNGFLWLSFKTATVLVTIQSQVYCVIYKYILADCSYQSTLVCRQLMRISFFEACRKHI